MTTYETIAIYISAIALIATAINVIFYFSLTKEYNGLVKEQNKIAQGQAETSMRELIISARRNVENISEKVAVEEGKNEVAQKIYEQMLDSAQEDLKKCI